MPTITAPETTLTRATATDGAEVPLLVHRPATPCGWLVWAHGGSWQHGSAFQWAPMTARLAARSGWAVVSVDYRLAPAHRFPAAILDMLAALDWAEQHADSLPVVIGGDSAGGTVAAVTALARRNSGDRVPAQVLAYPPLDPGCARPSYGSGPGAFPNRTDLRAAWQRWLGPDPAGAAFPATPLRSMSLAGLSPVSLIVGDGDPVRDDVTEYAGRLRVEKVSAALHLLPGTGHADILNPSGLVLPAIAAELNEKPAPDPPRSVATVTDHLPHHLEGTLP